MRLFGFPFMSWLTPCAAIGLFLCLFACPNEAAAGCGDYVLRGKNTTEHATIMPPQQDPSAQSGEHRFPCSGPSCTNGSYPPIEPLTTTSTVVEHWAIVKCS